MMLAVATGESHVGFGVLLVAAVGKVMVGGHAVRSVGPRGAGGAGGVLTVPALPATNCGTAACAHGPGMGMVLGAPPAFTGGSGAAALCPAGVQPDSPTASTLTPLGCFLLEEVVRLPGRGEQGTEQPYIPIANRSITVRSLAGFDWEQCGGMQGLTVPGPAPRGFFGLRLSLVHTQQSVLRLAAAPRATHRLLSVSHPAQPAAAPAPRCLLPLLPAWAHRSPLVSVSAQATAADGGGSWQFPTPPGTPAP